MGFFFLGGHGFFFWRSWTVLSPRPSHLCLAHIMEQLHAQFTENVLAEKDVECDRTACDTNGGIIPAGQRRYYVFPKLDKNGVAHGPGKYCCKNCYIYYRGQKDTVIRTVLPATSASSSGSTAPSALGPDIKSIRQNVNESQRQGRSF